MIKKKQFDPIPGTTIDEACVDAVDYAQKHGTQTFDFNGIKLTATEDTDPVALAFLYRSAVDAKHINEQKHSVG